MLLTVTDSCCLSLKVVICYWLSLTVVCLLHSYESWCFLTARMGENSPELGCWCYEVQELFFPVGGINLLITQGQLSCLCVTKYNCDLRGIDLSLYWEVEWVTNITNVETNYENLAIIIMCRGGWERVLYTEICLRFHRGSEKLLPF
jgi:hypothetical protein